MSLGQRLVFMSLSCLEEDWWVPTSSVISGSDTDLSHVALQVASPAKRAITLLSTI